jgi:rubrerythrin
VDERILQIIDESIQLELNVSNVYKIFASLFSEHRNFWWRLVIEEKNHAALLKSLQECFVPVKMVPVCLLCPDLKMLKDTNDKIEMLVKEYKVDPPSLKKAFDTAYNLEQSAGEIHYQTFMQKLTNQRVEKIFQELNGDDKDHAQRILSYMDCTQSQGS